MMILLWKDFKKFQSNKTEKKKKQLAQKKLQEEKNAHAQQKKRKAKVPGWEKKINV